LGSQGSASWRTTGAGVLPTVLPPDSFFRQIPHALETRARLILEAVGWAIDSILISFDDLKTVALATSSSEASGELDHRLLVHCWSIVDQCHMLRSLLQRLSKTPHSDIDQFVEKTEPFTLVRNSMDHLSDRLDNMLKAKISKPPVFGAVSWIGITSENVRDHQLAGYTLWNVSSGTVVAQPQWAIAPVGVREINSGEPVSHFKFEAFDHFLDISELIEEIGRLVDHFEGIVKPRIEGNIREGAKKRGLDPDEVLKARGSGSLKMGFVIKRGDRSS
jgi:hypothetical protein